MGHYIDNCFKLTYQLGMQYQFLNGQESNVCTRVVIFEKWPEKQKPLIFESVPLRTTSRKMRTTWNPTLAQDLEWYNAMDAKAEYLEDKHENKLTRIVIVEKWKQEPVWSHFNLDDFVQSMEYFRSKLFDSVGIPSRYLSP